MKKFFAGLLKNVLTLVLGYIALFVIALLILGAMVARLETPEQPVRADSILVFDLNANISDAPSMEGPAALVGNALGGGSIESFHLLELLNAIESAADDERIAGLFLHGSLTPEGYGSGLATVREVRRALLQFRESGKPVVAYLDQPGLRDYYLASTADRVVLNPFGMLALNGLVAELPFFAEALETLGIGVQVVRAGDYKSAVEPFVRMGMSDENREQQEALLDDLWAQVLGDIAGSRGLTTDAIRSGGLQGAGIYDAAAALSAGLVDETAYFDEVLDSLIESGRYDEEIDSFVQVGLRRYIKDTRAPTIWEEPSDVPEIAVVYAEGDIVDGGGNYDEVGGEWLARKLRELRGDPNIAGVVLRVNSPGGSAVASETIHRELVLLGEQVPVAVSFGTVAASGGYWIASPAPIIFAESTTITGSIGVFGLIPNIEAVAGRLGVAFDRVRTDPYADIDSLTRPKTDDEIRLIQGFVDRIYTAFVERVAVGRALEIDAVEALSGGRVYSGAEAERIGLVDRIGGLRSAIEEVSASAGVEDYRIRQVPEKLTAIESLAGLLAPAGDYPVVRSAPARRLPLLLPELESALKMLENGSTVYARLPFDMIIR